LISIAFWNQASASASSSSKCNRNMAADRFVSASVGSSASARSLAAFARGRASSHLTHTVGAQGRIASAIPV
jgi:hypothetical protein